jgi:hypothetical protein
MQTPLAHQLTDGGADVRARTPTLGVDDVRELVRPTEPIASVYLGPRRDSAADAELDLLLRRRRIARHLCEQGASNPTVDAVLGHLAKLPEYSQDYAVFAGGDQVMLTCHLPGGIDADLAAYTAPAKVAPVLAWLQRHPAHVQAVGDRAGADLTGIAQEESRHGNAVQGVTDTLRVLAGGLARTLLIVDDPTDVRTAWFGPELLCVSEQPDTAVREHRARRGHLSDIAIRAALLTRAEVRILTPAEGAGLTGGIAALLRPR